MIRRLLMAPLATLVLSMTAFATDHVINTQGLSYNPSELTVNVGDNVTINASGTHPTTQVSEETWNANGVTPLPGGFGTNTASFTFAIESAETIYYVCDSHVGNGMKGMITVMPLSVDDITELNPFQIMNNPVSSGNVVYSLEDESLLGGTIEFVQLDGKLAFRDRIISDSGTLETGLSQGVYLMILRRSDNAVISTEKVMFQD